jgi:hypothetical protein
MKSATILVLLGLAALAFVPATALADPCPSNCTPPVPCGWAPDIRKDPVGWAEWAAECPGEIVEP